MQSQKAALKPTVLIILDGWGHREDEQYNAIAKANTPTWDMLWQQYPHCLLNCCGADVGLPEQQMGNSEVGHMTIGAGQVIFQDLSRINQAIDDGSFANNPTFNAAINDAIISNSRIHLMGLLSPGGVHSHEQHFHAFLQLAASCNFNNIALHLFLDGRDTPPQSAKPSIVALQTLCQQLNVGQIASITGRYWAMDRDKNIDRTQAAYDLLTQAKSPFQAPDPLAALEAAYARGETDEFVQPTAIISQSDPITICPEDSVVFMNFRADRARQLSQLLIQPQLSIKHFITLTEYAKDLPSEVAFPKPQPSNVLGQWLQKHQYKQLRLAETEKYAHVTFFLNGGVEAPFEGEDRILIPSPKVATYDLQPQMSALEVTRQLTTAIGANKYDVIVCNYANADMVGHTGNFKAAIHAVEALDQCLAAVFSQLKQTNGQALITADHGNVEMMYNTQTQQKHTAHTHAQVPLVYFGNGNWQFKNTTGSLADIAPTLLQLLYLPIPEEMTGIPLLTPIIP